MLLREIRLRRQWLQIEYHLLLLNNQMVKFLSSFFDLLRIIILRCRFAWLFLLIIQSLMVPHFTRLRSLAIEADL